METETTIMFVPQCPTGGQGSCHVGVREQDDTAFAVASVATRVAKGSRVC